jgi:alkaline phosphatase D
LNDADGTLSFKEESRKLFLEFAGEPKDSPRWNRNGIFQAYSFDSGRIKIIMLDVRFNRSHDDILGEEQWKWLNQEMADDVAKIKFLVSPIQVLVLDRPLQEKFSQQWKSFVRLAELISYDFFAFFFFFFVIFC